MDFEEADKNALEKVQPTRRRVREARRLPSRTERAWAAGFWDGEGCTSITYPINHSTKRPHCMMMVNQKTEPLVRRFHSIVQVGRIGSYHQHIRNYDYFNWSCGTFEEIQFVLCLLWEFLGIEKRAQARIKLIEYVQYRKDNPDKRFKQCQNNNQLVDA